MPSKPLKIKRPWVPESNQAGIANRSRDAFYHTHAWKKAARMFIQSNPLCAKCKEKGMLVPSVVTDHVIPKDACKDQWDSTNWQPLCKKCHAEKSAGDKKWFGGKM